MSQLLITVQKETPTLISESGLSIGSNPPEGLDDLHVQRMLVLVLWVLQEGGQLHLDPLQ